MYHHTYPNTWVSNRTHKKITINIERNGTRIIKWSKWWRANMYHETTPFIVFICNKKRIHEIFLKSKLKTSTLILIFKNYFLTSSALKTLVPPNLCLLLHLSQILNIFNVSFSSSLNRLNTLGPKICTNRQCTEPGF